MTENSSTNELIPLENVVLKHANAGIALGAEQRFAESLEQWRLAAQHAAARLGRLDVSVYADNPSAVDFYRRRGFVETGRQETDDEGLPFTVIHMARTP